MTSPLLDIHQDFLKILDGSVTGDIYEVASYEGLYGGIAEKGERIAVYGKIERVISRKDEAEYHPLTSKRAAS